MIEINDVSMKYGTFPALSGVSLTVKDGSVYGLIGSNGSGKSTLLRLLCGAFKPEGGQILYGQSSVWENETVKREVVYLSDEQYFFPHNTMIDMADFYASVYSGFSYERFYALCEKFGLEPKRRINTFSKGMMKQTSVILALSCNTAYILCDETFDGLDPVVRESVKRMLADEVAARSLTVILASHNLRELEDICDHMALLHKGKVLLESDVDDVKMNIHKVQTILPEGASLSGLDIVRTEVRGSVSTFIIRGAREQVVQTFDMYSPKFFEMIPLTLEEIFITEMEEAGYEIAEVLK